MNHNSLVGQLLLYPYTPINLAVFPQPSEDMGDTCLVSSAAGLVLSLFLVSQCTMPLWVRGTKLMSEGKRLMEAQEWRACHWWSEVNTLNEMEKMLYICSAESSHGTG